MQRIGMLIALSLPLLAQDKSLKCDGERWNGRQERFCEIREAPLPYAGRLNVDAGTNGGITVKGWNRAEVLVRSKVDAWAATLSEAKAIAGQVRVEANSGQVQSSGPEMRRELGWSVSFEIFVPNRADLNLKAHNGGISITDVAGRIEFDTMNGGVRLARLGGDVRGQTMNGGLTVTLAGARWDGQQLDVATKNGGVKMSVPANYSAKLETSTVNGGISIDFPVTVQGDIDKKLSVNLGNGGPLVRVVTTNGGVKIAKT